MAEFKFDEEAILKQVFDAARGGMVATTQRAVTTAKALNRERRFDTGQMTGGWYPLPVVVEGNHVRGGFANDVEWAGYQDHGTSTIAPAHISDDAADAEFPSLPDEIAIRM